MLFFLMKMDRKLWFQVLVLGLIIGVGILPSKTTEAFRCYGCNAREDEDYLRDDLCDTKRHKIEEDCSGACLTKTDKHGKVVHRLCDILSSGKANHICAHEVFGGCYVNSLANRIMSKWSDCQGREARKALGLSSYRSLNEETTTNGGSKGRLNLDYIHSLEYCYCDTDLCNGPPGSADGDRTTPAPDPDEYGPRSSGVMTAFPGRLILVGVTVVGVLVAATASRVMSVSNI